MSTEQITTFAVPDLGEGLEEVTVTSWDVAVGDEVELNQTLCSVETAKAEVEIPSPYAGRIVELGGAEGDVLAVGRRWCGSIPVRRLSPRPSPSTRRRRCAQRCWSATAPTTPSTPAAEPARAAPDPKLPGARKLAAELGVDLGGVPPGPRGVITTDGVLAAAAADRSADELRPVSRVQAAMAERMTMSRSKIPDAHAAVQVDCTNLLQLRDRLADHVGGTSITPFTLTLRLVILALTRHPVLNATWVDAPEGPGSAPTVPST